ncbi:hypothetical protein ACFQZ4_15695 [Catellatospora coxensis]
MLGLFARLLLPDDVMYDVIQTVPAWLAPGRRRRAGSGSRARNSLHPWLNFYVQDGHPYVAEPGGVVQPLAESAPPFTLRQTTD